MGRFTIPGESRQILQKEIFVTIRSSNICEIFSLRLESARKNRKMSQQDVGDMAGIHPSHISRMEGGKQRPMLETVYRLATALSCSSDYLLGLSDSMDNAIPQESYDQLVMENESLRKIIQDAMKVNQ